MKWKTMYGIGIDKVDEQHEKLFEISQRIEELFLLPRHIDKFDEMVEIIEELKAYTMYHFNEEQKLMQSVQYPKYFSHLVEHQDFIEKMNALDIHELDKAQQEQIRGLVDFMMTWLVEHVLERDRAFATYYAERNS